MAPCAGAPKTVGEYREALFTAAMLGRSLREFFSARQLRMQSAQSSLPPNAVAEQYKTMSSLLCRMSAYLQKLLPEWLRQESDQLSVDELLGEFLRYSAVEAADAGFEVVVGPCACPHSSAVYMGYTWVVSWRAVDLPWRAQVWASSTA
jgi:hypothetical protein